VEFENIANRLFEEKSNKFSKQSKENIEQLLSPLRENLKEFKKKVEETYDKESKERFSLEGKIKDHVELNQQISKDATNLTNALKGQSKTQGDWGEMILESILEYSGLVKSRQYFIQESFKDEQGRRKQPDVIIKYPDNRYVIIDSKVSLRAYEQFANSENTEEQKIHLANYIKAVKNHIDDLSSKEYEQLDKALDFVFLFIPIEPAFLTALQHDNNLWNYAYSKRIVLMSPTNLIATLKVIADVWSKEIQNNNAREISKRGEMLFNKFVGFVDDMDDIEKHLVKANDSFDNAMKKLSAGRGNLIGQAENLGKLGVNSKKRLPEKYLLDNVELEEEDDVDSNKRLGGAE
jgi:DNA recombination protein RmuC